MLTSTTGTACWLVVIETGGDNSLRAGLGNARRAHSSLWKHSSRQGKCDGIQWMMCRENKCRAPKGFHSHCQLIVNVDVGVGRFMRYHYGNGCCRAGQQQQLLLSRSAITLQLQLSYSLSVSGSLPSSLSSPNSSWLSESLLCFDVGLLVPENLSTSSNCLGFGLSAWAYVNNFMISPKKSVRKWKDKR